MESLCGGVGERGEEGGKKACRGIYRMKRVDTFNIYYIHTYTTVPTLYKKGRKNGWFFSWYTNVHFILFIVEKSLD